MQALDRCKPRPRTSLRSRVPLAAICLLLITVVPAWAGISTTGDVTPDPATTDASDALIIGKTADGTMTVDGGSDVISQTGSIASKSGTTSSATITGAGSTWTHGMLYIGKSGDGTLNVLDGGWVQSTVVELGSNGGSSGQANVGGSNARWDISGDLNVGMYQPFSVGAAGALSITDTGLVSVSGHVHAEPGLGSIDLNNGTLTTGSLSVGANALTGTGVINTQGILSDVDLVFDATHGLTQTLTMNSEPGQNITVNLDLMASRDFGVGFTGQGSLMIADGVAVQSAYTYLAARANSTAIATVTGPGSSWTSTGLQYIGGGGNAELNITDGGKVFVDSSTISYQYDTTTIASGPMSVVEINIDGAGSEWSHSHTLYIGRAGDVTIDITNGGKLTNTDAVIAQFVMSSVEVTLDGATSTWINNGDLTVADTGQGTLRIKNQATVLVGGELSVGAAGTLAIELDETAPTPITVTGDAALDGTLAIDLHASYTPTAGDTFTALTANSVAGTFDAVDDLPIAGDVMFGLLYETTSVIIEAALAGDFNGDGFVGQDDLNILLASWGENVTAGVLLEGDASGDGFVGQDDLNLVLSYWGEGEPPSFTLVPEPATLGLMLAALGLSRRRSLARAR